MAAGRGRRKRAHHHEEVESEERWLLTYADMITLLMCLFMVLFSISSVNTSKFEALQRALQDAFSGQILPGGKSVMETGSGQDPGRAAAEPPLPALMPLEALDAEGQEADAGEATGEQETFEQLKRRVDEFARAHGLQRKLDAEVRRRGLVIRLLTDGILFDSGQAQLKPQAVPVLAKLAALLRDERKHPIVVEGYTDSAPISGAAFPSNWELSGARAASVVREFIADGVPTRRLSTAGHAHLHPIDTNATAQGRSRNRRVEVVLTRLNTPQGGGSR